MEIKSPFHFPSCKSHCLDGFLGTLFDAGATVSTLILIDVRHIVLHRNCTSRTILFADVAGNTADLAVLIDKLAHVLGLAGNYLSCLVRNQVDEVSRADVNALATGLALIFVNNSHAVHNMDGIKLAY